MGSFASRMSPMGMAGGFLLRGKASNLLAARSVRCMHASGHLKGWTSCNEIAYLPGEQVVTIYSGFRPVYWKSLVDDMGPRQHSTGFPAGEETICQS